MSWVTGALALGLNVYAFTAALRGGRASDDAIVARYARRCGWSAVAFASVSGAVVFVSLVTSDAYRGDHPKDQAARMAATISEVINGAGFTALAVLLPGVVAVVLRTRARRIRARG